MVVVGAAAQRSDVQRMPAARAGRTEAMTEVCVALHAVLCGRLATHVQTFRGARYRSHVSGMVGLVRPVGSKGPSVSRPY